MKYLFYLSFLFMAISACKKDAAPDIIYTDTLTTNNLTWTVDSNSISIRKFDQGHYSIRVDSPQIITYTLAPYSSINFPYTVQVDGTPILDDANQLGGFAIVFNYVDHSDYDVAEVWTNGTYRIWNRTNGNILTVVNFTYSAAIPPGSNNKSTIKVVQNQSNMQLQINGTSVGTFNISLPSSLVQTGLATSTAGINYFTPVTSLFNNFSIAKN
jgi:hypothetical protein